MATFTKRGPYQWQVKIRKMGHKPISKTFHFKDDAEAWARDIEADMDRGIYISRKEAESTTLADAIDRYVDEYILKKIKHPAPEFYRAQTIKKRSWGSRFLSTFRGKDIAVFIKDRESEGATANTIRLEIAIISNLFNVAASDWGMESLKNPVNRANRPKIPKGRVRRLEVGEEEKILKSCSPKFKPVFNFAIETAMRRGEIASLVWSNINLKRRFAHLHETKNGTARSVPLSPKAIHILKSLTQQDGVRSCYLTCFFAVE